MSKKVHFLLDKLLVVCYIKGIFYGGKSNMGKKQIKMARCVNKLCNFMEAYYNEKDNMFKRVEIFWEQFNCPLCHSAVNVTTVSDKV